MAIGAVVSAGASTGRLGSIRPTRGELLLGGGFALLGCSVLAALVATGRVLTGGENQVAADQLQYLSWIVSASDHGFIRSLWSIPEQSSSSFVEPGFLLSALAHRAGLSPLLSYQLWKPLSIALLVIGFAAYVRRTLPIGGARTAGLALALFGLSPAGAIFSWGQLSSGWRAQIEFATGEVFAAGWIWGYMMTAIAVATLPLCLLAAERGLGERRAASWVAVAAALALVCSWLQPWQGAELVGAIIVVGILQRKQYSVSLFAKRHLPVVVAGLLPLVYYRWLAHTDPVWELAGTANNALPAWPLSVWLLAFAPYLAALPAWLRRPRGWQDTALRAMPALMLLEYFAITVTGAGTFAFHALQGFGLFIAILVIRSALLWRDSVWWSGKAWLAIGLCLVFCVPGSLHRLNLMRLEIHRSAQPYFLEPGEDAALTELERDPLNGGVLAPIKAALTVPSRTGRPVWVGQLSWTPDFRKRVARAELLFNGSLNSQAARDLVIESRARFLYSDCGHRTNLSAALGPLIQSSASYGCARIYRVRGVDR